MTKSTISLAFLFVVGLSGGALAQGPGGPAGSGGQPARMIAIVPRAMPGDPVRDKIAEVNRIIQSAEGGKGSTSTVVTFQLRPDPLATLTP